LLKSTLSSTTSPILSMHRSSCPSGGFPSRYKPVPCGSKSFTYQYCIQFLNRLNLQKLPLALYPLCLTKLDSHIHFVCNCTKTQPIWIQISIFFIK
jgi:hypothetical protein